VRSRPWIDRLAIAAVVLVAAADLLRPRGLWSGSAAGAAALLLVLRMSGWQTLRTRGDPLLWSLHLGYAWVPVALACIALADLGGAIPWATGLHALTAGAFGTMILAVTTRVGLGHTGRELRVPPAIVTAYVLISLAALVRVVGPLAAPQLTLPLLATSGLLWMAAFALFLVSYAPILLRPRIDGLEG
jgi:uncharacterized protein involved in response to NO